MASAEPNLRLFVALDLPQPWKDALAALQLRMQGAVAGRFGDAVRPRWVRPEGIHLTLKFLGATPAARLDAVTAALDLAVADPPAFDLSLARVGSFEDRRAPRVILATVAGDTRPLAGLAARIETHLAAAGWPRERRAFHPHLTLARLPDTMDDATRHAVAALTGALQPPSLPLWHVDRVHLIRSHLGPAGARYEPLATFPRPALQA